MCMGSGESGITTITSMLAQELSKYKKTLIIDATNNYNLTTRFKNELKYNLNKNVKTYNLFINEKTLFTECISKYKSENLYFIPNSGPGLEFDLNKDIFIEKLESLIKAAENEKFEYLLFDINGFCGQFEEEIIKRADVVMPILKHEEWWSDHWLVDMENMYTNWQFLKYMNELVSWKQVNTFRIYNKIKKLKTCSFLSFIFNTKDSYFSYKYPNNYYILNSKQMKKKDKKNA